MDPGLLNAGTHRFSTVPQSYGVVLSGQVHDFQLQPLIRCCSDTEDATMSVQLLSTLISLSCAASVSQSSTTCTAGDYTLGQTAWITCFFPQDVADNRSIYMEFYPENHPEKQVLLCRVAKLKRSECSANEGFVFQNATRNSVTVAIPAVTEAAAGQYMCQLVWTDGTPAPMCNLTVTVSASTEKETPWIENRDETTSSPEHQQDFTKTPENGEAPNDEGLMMLTCLSVACNIVLTFVIIALIYKSKGLVCSGFVQRATCTSCRISSCATCHKC